MLKQNIICREILCVDLTWMGENDYSFNLIKEVYIEVGRVHAWQALTRPTVRHEVVNRLAVIII